MNIKGSRIIITGAGAGFGKEMALEFSKNGAIVAAIDINPKSLESLKTKDPKISTWICNVADNSMVEKTINEIFLAFGGLEVLINNAGIMKNAPLINILNRADKRHSIELWNNVIAVNQSSVFYMTRACADNMINKRCKGVIINISSISANGNIGQTAYSASKAAVEAMTKVWAKELGRFAIRCVAVAPGFINSSGTHDAIEDNMLSQWVEKTPIHRTGTIEEIVKTVSFIIDNDFINGSIISVNGGLTI